MSHGLHIFRYGNGIGMRNHKMAFVQHMDDGEIRLLFHDRSVKAKHIQISTSILVNEENLKKSMMYRSIFTVRRHPRINLLTSDRARGWRRDGRHCRVRPGDGLVVRTQHDLRSHRGRPEGTQ